jgi:hypothetical protein
MTDSEIKQAMRVIAAVSGLNLTDERIDRDLPIYKSYIEAMERIRRGDLPVEAEPMPHVTLKPERRS